MAAVVVCAESGSLREAGVSPQNFWLAPISEVSRNCDGKSRFSRFSFI